MPGARDKLLLNSRTSKGANKDRNQQYKALDRLTEEIEDNGWLDDPEVEAMRQELETECDAHDAADDKYNKFLKGLAKRMYKFIEKRRKLSP